uniref:Regulator of G protein signaling 13 n=1 Tax=Buteo japonicus TaxID=224669 RepID=A0A8C0BKJ8_9AVES
KILVSLWICLIVFTETRKNKVFRALSLHSEMPLRSKEALHVQENAMLTCGPMIYKAYLKTEHTYKITSQKKRISVARKLFTSYIQPQAPNELNIDSPARKAIIKNIQEPTQSCFDEAQKIIYMHMERDFYP